MVTEIQGLQCLPPKRNSSSCSSSSWKDSEGNDDDNPQYTSLKDILDESPPPRGLCFCFDETSEMEPYKKIRIKNELVRRAASCYLQSSARSIPSNDSCCLPAAAFCYELKSKAASVYSWWRPCAVNPMGACLRPILRFIHNLLRNAVRLLR